MTVTTKSLTRGRLEHLKDVIKEGKALELLQEGKIPRNEMVLMRLLLEAQGQGGSKVAKLLDNRLNSEKQARLSYRLRRGERGVLAHHVNGNREDVAHISDTEGEDEGKP